MRRFEKLNNDIQELGQRLIANQDLCKLLYYQQNNPLDLPEISGKSHILNKKILLFTPKLPLATATDVYMTVRVPKMRPSSKDGYYIVSMLSFDIYCHRDIREIYYTGTDGNMAKGDRSILLLDKVDEVMKNVDTSIGKCKLHEISEIYNSDATFSGYSAIYIDLDFRNAWG